MISEISSQKAVTQQHSEDTFTITIVQAYTQLGQLITWFDDYCTLWRLFFWYG